MSSTISNTITAGITLGSGTFSSPLTVTSTGYIDNTGTGDAIYGPNTQAWAVYNGGRIVATDPAGDGIDFENGGYVDNAGTIKGGDDGIFITGAAGTVTNSGAIIGTSFEGIRLQDGGSVDNTGTGLISGPRGVSSMAPPAP